MTEDANRGERLAVSGWEETNQVGGFGISAGGFWVGGFDSLTANRLPLTATTYFDYLGRLPHVEANFACTYGQEGLSPGEPAERVRLPEGGAAMERARGLGCSSG